MNNFKAIIFVDKFSTDVFMVPIADSHNRCIKYSLIEIIAQFKRREVSNWNFRSS